MTWQMLNETETNKWNWTEQQGAVQADQLELWKFQVLTFQWIEWGSKLGNPITIQTMRPNILLYKYNIYINILCILERTQKTEKNGIVSYSIGSSVFFQDPIFYRKKSAHLRQHIQQACLSHLVWLPNGRGLHGAKRRVAGWVAGGCWDDY